MVFSLLNLSRLVQKLDLSWVRWIPWEKSWAIFMAGSGRKQAEQETGHRPITKPPWVLIQKEAEQQSNAVNGSFTERDIDIYIYYVYIYIYIMYIYILCIYIYIYMMRYGICLGRRLQPTGWTIFSCYIFQHTFHVIHPLYSVVQLYISQLLFLRFCFLCLLYVNYYCYITLIRTWCGYVTLLWFGRNGYEPTF